MNEQDFTATSHTTAEQKYLLTQKLIRWIAAGCPRQQFTRQMYGALSCMFQHIAHYNIDGFYGRWFGSPDLRHEWIERVIKAQVYGDPAYTFSDVERHVQAYVRSVTPQQLELQL